MVKGDGGGRIEVIITGGTICEDGAVKFCFGVGVTVMIVGGTVTILGGNVTVTGGGVNVEMGVGVVVKVVAGAVVVVPEIVVAGEMIEEEEGEEREEEDDRPRVPVIVMAARETEDASATRFHLENDATAMYEGTVTRGIWAGEFRGRNWGIVGGS